MREVGRLAEDGMEVLVHEHVLALKLKDCPLKACLQHLGLTRYLQSSNFACSLFDTMPGLTAIS
jgi:hypothetical protein